MTQITHQKLIELGFLPSCNSGTFLIFWQDGKYDLSKPHHILYDKPNQQYVFRGRGHTIANFNSMEELKELMDKHIRTTHDGKGDNEKLRN